MRVRRSKAVSAGAILSAAISYLIGWGNVPIANFAATQRRAIAISYLNALEKLPIGKCVATPVRSATI